MRTSLFITRVAITLLVVVSLWAPGAPVTASDEAAHLDDLPETQVWTKAGSKLQQVLAELVTASERLEANSFSASRGMALEGDRVRVVIESRPEKAHDVAERARELGATVEATHANLIQALAPISQLSLLAGDERVDSVRSPLKANPDVVTEGKSLVKADLWQSTGFTGSGVKIGILDLGFADYAALLGTELPASVTTHWAASVGGPGSSRHGTAVTEIIYDIAPGAQLYLANFETEVEWANAVDWLVGQGVSVISHSISWAYAGPGDGTGQIDNVVKSARGAGVLWSQSAGNRAQQHWSGTFKSTDGDSWHEFKSSPTVDEGNTIYAEAGDQISVFLRWDDPWGSSSNDYDLYLVKSDTNVGIATSTNRQSGGQNPYEVIAAIAPSTGNYYVAIRKYSATRNVSLELLSFSNDFEYAIAAGSLTNPADSPDAMTVGAVYWKKPTTLEYFSSQGPTKDNRKKPDLVALDGVSTASYGSGGFYGTSPAAPHVSGAAALVKHRFPDLTAAQIQGYIEANAVDLGTKGKDNMYGSGRLQMGSLAAVTVTSPNGGESWAEGSTQTVSWTSSSLTGSVKVDLSRDGGTTWSNIIPSASVSAGNKTWKVSGTATTQARIRVSSLPGGAVSDTSNANFTITGPPPPSVTVSAPNGGETWAVGSTQTVSWTSSSLTGSVKVDLSRDGGTTWSNIIPSASVSAGNKTWKISGTATTQARIRVSSLPGGAVSDTSNANFKIE